MRAPERLTDVDLGGVVLVTRFGVDQGVKSDGTRKARARALRESINFCEQNACVLWQVRAVDDCSIAGINAATHPRERMRHETIDHLLTLCKLFTDEATAVPRVRRRRARRGCRHQRCRACLGSTSTPPSGGSRCDQSIGN